jgi:peptidoglycan/LPS O-acetylase OafA/YrhL
MASEVDMESPPLFDYLKQEIPMDELLDYASPKRIRSIDFVKGFAIVLIMMAHISEAWLDKDWIFVYAVLFCGLDFLGPSLFIFLSALSVIFSIKNKEGVLPEKVIRNRVFSRAFTIMSLGIIMNLTGLNQAVYQPPFPLNLWGWNILMFLGFSQIASYYALKLKKHYRAIIGLIIIAVSQPLREFLFLNKDSDMFIWALHFIITSPAPQLTLFPWLSICFISTIFGEYLYKAMIRGTEQDYIYLFRIFLFWGIIFVIAGVAFGLRLRNPDNMEITEYVQLYLFEIMNQQNYFQFEGVPEFLIRGTSASMFYNLGAALLVISVSFYFIDLKKRDNRFVRMMIYYGKISLSLFLIHIIFASLFVRQLNIIFALIALFAYVAFMGFLMYIWNTYGNGVGSPEWMMVQFSRVGQKTGQKVKREIRKTELMIKSFTNMIAIRKKTKLEKMEDFLAEEKKKRLKKVEKKERKKKVKAVHKQMGFDKDE